MKNLWKDEKGSLSGVWITGIVSSAICFMMYIMFAKFQLLLSQTMIGLNAPAATQAQLNWEYNTGFLIMGIVSLLIPALWTFWKEKRSQEY